MSDPSHSRAAGAYGSTAAATDPRALEGHVLLKSAQILEDLMNALKAGEKVSLTDIGMVLDHNQKLWTLLASDATDAASPLPDDLKNNIASLAAYIFNRMLDIRADCEPGKFEILIKINRNIASGLLSKKAESPSTPSAAASGTDSMA